jgi:UDP-N-acetylmuramoylalanine--D-glutamate ligase
VARRLLRIAGDQVVMGMWQGKKTALVGMGRSNMALGRYLLERGAEVTGLDQKTIHELGERGREAAAHGMRLVTGAGYLDNLEGYDVLFLTPGIKKSLPPLKLAEQRGTALSSEINVFFDVCKAPIIGFTGSAGKTTTTSIAGEILKADGSRPVVVGGNIGNPLVEIAEQIPAEAIVVLELSSFQLQLLRKSPHIGAVLNISPNHLDIHDSMEEYVESKKNIFRFARPDGWAILNHDNEGTRAMAAEAAQACRVAMFSRRTEVGPGAGGAGTGGGAGTFLRGDVIMFSDGCRTVECGSIKERLIPGDHNVENILAATTAAMLVGARPEAVAQAVRRFPGVEHRLELVRVANDVVYYNDSIATAPDRTAAALHTVERPIILIAGGYDKGIEFDELAPVVAERVKILILVGATSRKIAQAVYDCAEARRAKAATAGGVPGEPAIRPLPTIVFAKTFEEAVACAGRIAQPGEAVLLSPACASFDMFANFEERGRRFKELVGRL